MKTIYPTALQEKERLWYLFDAAGKTLGRLSTEIAQKLRGKDRIDFAPHVDNGAYVIVINTSKIAVTGRKMDQKMYYKHSGYLGNLKAISLAKLMYKDSRKVIEFAVSGMLPKNKHRSNLLMRLKLYATQDHPHAPQKPIVMKS